MWRFARSIDGRRDRARSRRARAPRVEALEGRVVLDAGNTPATALNLGALAGRVTKIDSVSAADVDDWYKLNLAGPGDLHIRLTGLTGDAELDAFWDSNGDQSEANETVWTTHLPGEQDETIDMTGQVKGTYYIGVHHVYAAGGPASYTLQVTTDLAGSALGTARDLGSVAGLGGVVHDFVDWSDWSDCYKVTMPRAGDLTVLLSGMTADADLNLFDATGDLISYSVQGGTTDDSVHASGLAKGTYYIQVTAFWNAPKNPATNYSLQVETDTVGNTIAKALDLGDLTGTTKTATEFVGAFAGTGDVADVYQFTLASKRTFKALLSGLGGNDDLLLTDAAGTWLATSTNAGTANDSIQTTLGPGTYYVWIFTLSSGSNYNLSLTG